MTNEGLKEGIYGYGDNIKPKKIVLTAIVEDMDGNIKYIAFPNMDDVKGFNIKLNNDTTEIEMKDFEFAALKDDNGFFFYDAFEKDIKDEDVKTKLYSCSCVTCHCNIYLFNFLFSFYNCSFAFFLNCFCF